jgi:hypothetical protein
MAKKTKGTEVAVPEATLPATVDWDQLAGAVPSGLENVKAEDLGIPFLSIVQSNSPELKKQEAKYIDGSGVGDIFNTLSRQIVYEEGGEPMIFVPCAYDRLFVEWKPRTEGGGIVTSHRDPAILSECQRDPETGRDIHKNGNNIVQTAYFTGFRLTDGKPEQCVIGFSSTQLKKSRGWLNLAMAQKLGNGMQLPLYANSYKISTKFEKNNKGDWYGWTIELNGRVQDRELVANSSDVARSAAATVAKLLTNTAAPEEGHTDY